MKREPLSRFISSQQGAIAPIYAIALFALVGAAGIAFDYGRMVSMDTELQNAADQAALAAATQLTRTTGAKADAVTAAQEFFASHEYNQTNFANDGDSDGKAISVVTVEFYRTRDDADPETGNPANAFSADDTGSGEGDEDANFVRVVVKQRTAEFAMTPVVGAIAETIDAAATAGMGSSVCKVPPIMICHPDPTQDIDWADMEGIGIFATGHSTGGNAGNPGSNTQGNTWAPGDFGFLQVEDTTASNASRNEALLKALAYTDPPLDCFPVGENKVSTGNPQRLYDAINTRFDINDFPNNNSNGNVLSACYSGRCPAAQNVVKDFKNTHLSGPGGGNNKCRIGNNGWELPGSGTEFKPINILNSNNSTLFNQNTASTTIMGLPRDNCHYKSYIQPGVTAGWCPGGAGNGRFGNGVWGRADYFKTNHSPGGTVVYPTTLENGDSVDWRNITRYQTYRWEIANSNIPNVANGQRGVPSGQCATGDAGGIDRRVLTVAIVTNCSELAGQSVAVDIDDWVDVFLVEPSVDATVRHNAFKDGIYVEVIGPSKTAGGYTYGAQTVRRDVPYLVR